MIEITKANGLDMVKKYGELFKQHYSNDFRVDVSELDLNLDAYKNLADVDAHLFMVAEDEGTEVGYISVIISEHHQMQGIVYAVLDAVFVSPDHRKMGVAQGLIKAVEDELKDRGVSWFSLVFRDDESASKVAGPLGYEKAEVSYVKILEGEE